MVRATIAEAPRRATGVKAPIRRVRWTEAEDQLLREQYSKCRTAELAAKLGRKTASVYQRAYALGLEKDDEFLASPASGRLQPGPENPGHSTRFQAGQASWNKGVQGVTGHHPNTKRTQFRKGRAAAEARNYQPIGSTRVNNGVLERKVTDDPSLYPARRWRPVARLVWEAAHGPVPAGHAVVFLAGKASLLEEEITAGVLELVSRRELMLRNSRHTRYPVEVNQLIQLKAAVVRKVNNRINRKEQQA